MYKLVLVRHGQSTWNLENRFTGWTDVGLTDKGVVDGLVILVGWIVQESSQGFRRLQTGLVQNYAMVMLLGIFAFVTVYLFVR